MQMITRALLTIALFLCLLLPPHTATLAAPPVCNSATEGTILYNAAHKLVQFCNGTQWIGLTAKIGGVGDTLSDLSCQNGEIVKWNGTAWECAADSGGLAALQGADDPGACTLAKDGLIRYRTSGNPKWEYCDGGTTSWLPFRLPQCADDDTGECTLAALRSSNDPQFAAANLRCGSQLLGVTGTYGSGSSSAFTFTNATNAALSTLTTASAVTISGIPAGCPGEVSVAGQGSPQISVAGGAWGTSGTISNGQTLAVRLTSSASFSTAHTATIAIGSTEDTWSVTTRAPNNCTAASKTWLTNCTATITAANHGNNGTGTITDPGGCGTAYYGSGTFACSDGNFTYGSGSCTQQTACDTTPNTFDFTPNVTNANLSTLTTAANTVTISGINTATPVSVTGTGAQIEINNSGAWVTSGTIQNGQTLKLRLTSSASFSTGITATVNVGGVTDTWSVTTRAGNSCTAASRTWLTNCTATVSAAAHGANGTATITNPGGCGTTWHGSGTFACNDGAFSYSTGTCTQQTACDTTPNAFTFADVTGANPSTLTTATAITISGINTSTPVSVSGTGATISINGGAWVTSGNITNGQTLAVRLTSSASFSTAMSATVNVGGVTDSWSVTTRAANGCTVASGTTWTVSGKTCTTPSALSLAHGASGSRTDSTQPTTGSKTFTCTDGTVGQSGTPTCVQSCAASQTVSWSPGCSAPSGALLANGGSRSITNTASGYTGTRTIQCNNGTLAQSGGSCTSTCGGYLHAGYCWYMGSNNQSCDQVCSSHGGCDVGGIQNYTGTGSSSRVANCKTLLDHFGVGSGTVGDGYGNASGCYYNGGASAPKRRIGGNTTTCADKNSAYQRLCSCDG